MARLFVSFVHEDEKLASAVQGLLQTELNLLEEVFLSSDKSQIYAGDLWLQKIKEALSAAEFVILMLSQRSVARPWVNFEAGARGWRTRRSFRSATVIYRRMHFLIHIPQFRR
jgi:TIR domain